jgi:hypothetical protein
VESLHYGRLLGGEYRNNILLCAVMAKGRLVELNALCGGAKGRVEIWRNKARKAVSREQGERLCAA